MKNSTIRFLARAGACLALLMAWYACADQPVPTAPNFKPAAGSDTVVVDSTVPDNGPLGATMDVRVLGSGFTRGSQAEFALDGIVGADVVTNSTRYVKATELEANITIAPDATLDLYDVIVTTSNGRKGVGIESFAVTPVHEDLGTLGGDRTEATALNSAVQVVGYSRTGKCTRGGRICPPTHAFLWENGVMRDLGTLSGHDNSYARDVNDQGIVVGSGSPGDGTTEGAVCWAQGAGPVALPPPPGHSIVLGRAVSNGGLAAAQVGWNPTQAAVWTLASGGACAVAATDLLGPPAGAADVSETGRVLAWNAFFERDAAGQWQRFEFADSGNVGTAMSADGKTIVGNRSGPIAPVWTETSPGGPWHEELLPDLGGGRSIAYGVNANGTLVVGTSRTGGEGNTDLSVAVMWTRQPTGWRLLRLGEPKGHGSRAVDVVVLGDGTIKIAGLAAPFPATGAVKALLWTVQ